MDTPRAFAPGVAEAFAAQGADMSGILPATQSVAEVATPSARKPPIQHQVEFLAGGAPRRKIVSLEFPLRFDGREFRQLVVRRLTVAQVAGYVALVNEAVRDKSDEVVRLPMFEDDQGDEVPEGLLEALDADDLSRLNEAAESFLPRSFQTKAAESPSASD